MREGRFEQHQRVDLKLRRFAERLGTTRHEPATEAVANEMDPKIGTALADLSNRWGHADASHNTRPILHDVPRRQIQELPYAARDAAEPAADASSAFRRAGAQARQQLRSRTLADLRQPLGLVGR